MSTLHDLYLSDNTHLLAIEKNDFSALEYLYVRNANLQLMQHNVFGLSVKVMYVYYLITMLTKRNICIQ